MKREVWRRCGGKCCYRDPKTGKICGARAYLQFDHIVPVSLGGKNESSNLILLCFQHNQYQAMKKFGVEFMEYYYQRK